MIGSVLAVIALLALALAVSLLVRARGSEGKPPGERFAACPAKPNCVSSLAKGASHSIEPLSFSGDADAAWGRLKRTVVQLPRTTLVVDEDDYLAFECRSAVFGFIDDVEVARSPGATHFDIRSASRIGHSDLGVNRKRVEAIRAAFGTRESTSAGTP